MVATLVPDALQAAILPHILRLSNELLREILDHIESDPEKLINVDRRNYLSQESFKPPPRSPPNTAQTIGHFRLTCRKFSELGAVHQFARVTTRFSRHGFTRLDNIASAPHLAKHVKKFSYMVPYFYVEGRERVWEILPSVGGNLGTLDVSHFERKVAEQKDIVNNEIDNRALRKAMTAFTSLQHVQILRVQDQEDAILLQYIRTHTSLLQSVELTWTPACTRSTETIAAALLASQSPCSRLSSPMLNPQSMIHLSKQRLEFMGSLDSLDDRLTTLTCLELHFDDGTDLDNRIRALSPMFKAAFTKAKNIQAVHLGFPSHRPLSLKLEDVFHGVRWEKLLAFGIQAWRLDTEEIIALAQRHRERLKGLRLRDVLLKEGSRWKHILKFLRDDMARLDWVSLRRIGYAKHFDEIGALGAEVPDDPLGSESDSEEEDEWDPPTTDPADDDGSDAAGPSDPAAHNHLPTDSDGDFESDEDDDSDDDQGPEGANEMDFPQLSPDTPNSVPWCSCNGKRNVPEEEEDLGDNGAFVTNQQRKMWEKWVVRRCPEHSAV